MSVVDTVLSILRFIYDRIVEITWSFIGLKPSSRVWRESWPSAPMTGKRRATPGGSLVLPSASSPRPPLTDMKLSRYKSASGVLLRSDLAQLLTLPVLCYLERDETAYTLSRAVTISELFMRECKNVRPVFILLFALSPESSQQLTVIDAVASY